MATADSHDTDLDPNPLAPAVTPTGPHATAEDDEIVFYQGSPLLRGELGLVTTWVAIALVILAIPIIWYFVGEPADTPPWYVWLICIPLAILAAAIPAIWVRRNRYRVTNYRIDYERGLLTTDIDTLELWHVNDIRFRQTLVDKIFRVGTIWIDSDDRSTPSLELRSLYQPRPLFENLKQRVIAVKRQRGVIKMDMGG